MLISKLETVLIVLGGACWMGTMMGLPDSNLLAIIGAILLVLPLVRVAQKSTESRTTEDRIILFVFQKSIVMAFLGGVLFFIIGYGVVQIVPYVLAVVLLYFFDLYYFKKLLSAHEFSNNQMLYLLLPMTPVVLFLLILIAALTLGYLALYDPGLVQDSAEFYGTLILGALSVCVYFLSSRKIDKSVLKQKSSLVRVRNSVADFRSLSFGIGRFILNVFVFGAFYVSFLMVVQAFSWGALQNVLAGILLPAYFFAFMDYSRLRAFVLQYPEYLEERYRSTLFRVFDGWVLFGVAGLFLVCVAVVLSGLYMLGYALTHV